MNKQIEIYVETPELSEVVQKYLFTKGYSWRCGSWAQNTYAKYLQINADGDNAITYNSSNYVHNNFNPVFFNAATEFGKLVDFLSQPEFIEVEINNNRKVKVFKDKIEEGAWVIPYNSSDLAILLEASKKVSG
jgi:hypothetical protein